jgi:hypothetical protein
VRGFQPAPVAEFLKFDLALHQFLVFVGVIITPFANGTAHRDQPVGVFYLGHGENDTTLLLILQRGGQASSPAIAEPLAGIEPATYSLPWSCSTS